MSELRVEVSVEEGATVIRVAGDLEMETAHVLEEALASVVDMPAVIDARDVPFIDSTGLRVLLIARREGQRIVLRAPSPAVQQLLRIAGVEHIFPVER